MGRAGSDLKQWAPPWRDLRPDQRQWIEAHVANGVGPQNTLGGFRLLDVIARIDGITDGQLARFADAPEWLLAWRDAKDQQDLLQHIVELGTPAAVKHDYSYARGVPGKRKRADRALRMRWNRAVVASDLSGADKLVGEAVVRLCWIAVRSGGRKDYAKKRLTWAALTEMGCPT